MFLGSLRMKSQRRELLTMAIKVILPKKCHKKHNCKNKFKGSSHVVIGGKIEFYL
jgi:hypothetical protein